MLTDCGTLALGTARHFLGVTHLIRGVLTPVPGLSVLRVHPLKVSGASAQYRCGTCTSTT